MLAPLSKRAGFWGSDIDASLSSSVVAPSISTSRRSRINFLTNTPPHFLHILFWAFSSAFLVLRPSSPFLFSSFFCFFFFRVFRFFLALFFFSFFFFLFLFYFSLLLSAALCLDLLVFFPLIPSRDNQRVAYKLAAASLQTMISGSVCRCYSTWPL